jgi:REP element-mobilizing transposase RayT
MKENELPKRKNTRLQYYDYNSPGAYFITFCVHNRKNMLSRIVGAIQESPEAKLSEYGVILDNVIKNLPTHLKATVDCYVIMPNHVHMIILITDDEELGAIRESPLRIRSILSKLVGYIKMNASKTINKLYGRQKIWQRGYHDHIIRGRSDYDRIAKYICENPKTWQYDCFYSKE